jgi:hypothetical protein
MGGVPRNIHELMQNKFVSVLLYKRLYRDYARKVIVKERTYLGIDKICIMRLYFCKWALIKKKVTTHVRIHFSMTGKTGTNLGL